MRFEVKDVLSENDIQSGLRSFMKDALATKTMNSLTAPTLIVAFAILLGASNFAIGLLAAIPLLAQLVQTIRRYKFPEPHSIPCNLELCSEFSRPIFHRIHVSTSTISHPFGNDLHSD